VEWDAAGGCRIVRDYGFGMRERPHPFNVLDAVHTKLSEDGAAPVAGLDLLVDRRNGAGVC
jgi:hypothetical protein